MLLTIGLVMVLSSSSVYSYRLHDNSYFIVLKQLTWVAISLPIAWVAMRLPSSVLQRLAWFGLLLSIGLIMLTYTPLGLEVNGNQNWLAFGGFTLQPSEPAKLSLVLWAAHIFARKEALLHKWTHIIIPVVPMAGVVAGLVVLQHDLGTALVIFAIVLGMLFVVGTPLRLFGGAISVVSVIVLALAATNAERRSRLTTFLHPFQDYEGHGWQAAQGLLAMASGGIFGKGISASQQKWGNLPEAHTDFIFAVLGEELGLVGTLLVVTLFALMAFAMVRLAMQTEDRFARYVIAGVVIWLLGQAIINIGMVLALLPVIGIPLPLVSYGGSALVPTLAAIAIVLNFARREPEAARELAERRRLRKQARRGEREVAGLNAGAR
ncbi:MAG: putative lipid II flippase FtsW [Myxococcales bacterium]|nr:MAG: putative lipid II flippase FtsW [Myxococcales bacterium]